MMSSFNLDFLIRYITVELIYIYLASGVKVIPQLLYMSQYINNPDNTTRPVAGMTRAWLLGLIMFGIIFEYESLSSCALSHALTIFAIFPTFGNSAIIEFFNSHIYSGFYDQIKGKRTIWA
jgi:hypothetical protein